MKILQVAIGPQLDIRDALKSLGEVIYWDWSNQDRVFNETILQLSEKHKPDLIWLQIQTPGVINTETASILAERSIVVNWTGDVRIPLQKWFIDIGRYIHLTLFTNMADVWEIRKFGVQADYLQIGFPENIFTPDGQERKEAEIIFMGNNVGGFPLSDFRKRMVHDLTNRYGKRFKAFGINWPGYGPESNQDEEAKIYRGCKVAINLSHINYSRYSSDRIFRLMGAGAMCLSHNYNDIELDFKIKEHLDVWNTIDGLFGRIDHYLENEVERKKIARAGCQHVHTNCTWKHRINELVNLLIKYE